MNYDKFSRDELIELVKFYKKESEVKYVTPNTCWEDRMGGQFTQQEIDEANSNKW